jgi:hypothetical protein
MPLRRTGFSKPRQPLGRKTGLQRKTRLKPAGRKAKTWREVKQPVINQFFKNNQVYCLCCGSDDATPAHTWRRWHSTREMLKIFAPLCWICHQRIDAFGEYVAYVVITYLLRCAEKECEPEIDFRRAKDSEIKDFCHRLLPIEEFWKIRREKLATA